jgi:site-specific recombinase XerD
MSAFRLIRRGRSKTLRRLYRGPLAIYIDRIAAWYDEQGYGARYAIASLKSVDRFGRWLDRRRVKLRDVDEHLIDRYFLQCPARSHGGIRIALRRLLLVLRESGASPPLLVARGPAQMLEDDFKQYLVNECGLAAPTIENYVDAAHIFLAALFGQDRRDPSQWTAADVLTFVRQHAQARRPVHMQHLCVGLRSFLRYLRFRGKTQRDLASTVPRIAHWRLATLPKFLSPAQVKCVLANCNRYTTIGRRNHAVLMLLARLGLRASEVRSLTLDDIDWRNGHLTIHGKGRGPEQMPLPRDVGSALAAYLANGRPPSTSRAVFVRLTPPHTQFPNGGAVTSIAADAMRAAGVDAPRKGAHVFRHTLATRMLRDGASLREIGQVLRHRDEDTTRIYAKVDLTRLRSLALSWPGSAS